MLLRRYGSRLHSVQPDFNARALTEITFRRDGTASFAVEDFQDAYLKVDETALGPTHDGRVQSEAEEEVLRLLLEGIRRELDGLEPGEVLVVENQQGVDFPRLHDRKEGIVVDGVNRLHFHWRVDPPLRLGRYRRSDG